MGNISAAQREPHAKFATLKRRMKKKKLADNVLLLIGGQKVMTDSPISKNQLIAIEMRPTSAEKTELVVRFNRPFTTAEMNAMHRGLNLYLVGTPDETKPPLGQEPWRCSLPVITVQMLGDFGQEGFFEKTDEPVHGVPGVGWSQAAVDFACLIQGRRAEEPACDHVWIGGESGERVRCRRCDAEKASALPFERACDRCGKVIKMRQPVTSTVYYCSIECAE